MWKSAYGGNANKANKTNSISLLHHQLTFYIMMFKKEKFIPQMCILFYNQLWVRVWDYGRVGEGRYIHHRC